MKKHVSISQFRDGDMIMTITRRNEFFVKTEREYLLNTIERKNRITKFMWAELINPLVHLSPHISLRFNFPEE